MKSIFIALLLALTPLVTIAQGVIYEHDDSIRIEKILEHHAAIETCDNGALLISVAKEFIGESYIGNTLENGAAEPLYISCSKLDCTTFVELVVAIAMSIDKKEKHFIDVCRNLERIRYRQGRNSGYASRLHYISWWIADSAKCGTLYEATSTCYGEPPLLDCRKQRLFLNFMSTHPTSYPLLSSDTTMLKTIAEFEKPFRAIDIEYIPKESLQGNTKHVIKEGDIIAIVTSIEGLDVSHIGFAHYRGDTLHLLHASSAAKRVIIDEETLYNYLSNKKTHLGIRIFRRGKH